MTHDAHGGLTEDSPRRPVLIFDHPILERIRSAAERQLKADLDRVRAEAQARIDDQRKDARGRLAQLRAEATQQLPPRVTVQLNRDAVRQVASALEKIVSRLVVESLASSQSSAAPVAGTLTATLPALEAAVHGTATSSGSLEMTVIDTWPGTWSRATTRLVLQYYVAFLTFVVVGCWVDAHPELADELSVWTGGGVWPAALGAWFAVGKAFDKLYPPVNGDARP